MRLLEGGDIAERLGIEDDDVGDVALAQVAAFGEPENVGGQSRGAADRRRQRHDVPLDRVASDLAGKAAVGARVGHRVVRYALASVAGGGHKRLLHDLPHLVFLHPEVHHLRAAVPLDLDHQVRG
jgi:hypothetical protein